MINITGRLLVAVAVAREVVLLRTSMGQAKRGVKNVLAVNFLTEEGPQGAVLGITPRKVNS